MPKMSRAAAAPRHARRKPAPIHDEEVEDVSAWSVLLGLAMLVALVVAAAAWMGGSLSQVENRIANTADAAARTIGLSVDDVQVFGLETDSELERLVRGAAMVEPGENMFRADPNVIRERIESTGRVLSVKVHRLWPGQVVIIAEKSQPVAVWNDGAAWVAVDALGRPMDAVDPASAAHTLKAAGEGAPRALPALAAALEDAPTLSAKVSYARRVEGRRWDLHLKSGARARLPGDEDMGAAIARLDRVEARTALSGRDLAAIDLRSPGRIFLTPRRARVSSTRTTAPEGGAA